MPTADAVADDLHDKVREMASGSLLKSALPSIARAAGLTESQIRRLAHRQWKNVPAHVYLRVTKAYRNHLQKAEARAAHQAAVYRVLAEEYDRTWPNG